MGKCEFVGRCPLYNKQSVTCNKAGGMYYGWGEYPASCYMKMAEQYGKLEDELRGVR